jgi:hypothetical protein
VSDGRKVDDDDIDEDYDYDDDEDEVLDSSMLTSLQFQEINCNSRAIPVAADSSVTQCYTCRVQNTFTFLCS